MERLRLFAARTKSRAGSEAKLLEKRSVRKRDSLCVDILIVVVNSTHRGQGEGWSEMDGWGKEKETSGR